MIILDFYCQQHSRDLIVNRVKDGHKQLIFHCEYLLKNRSIRTRYKIQNVFILGSNSVLLLN